MSAAKVSQGSETAQTKKRKHHFRQKQSFNNEFFVPAMLFCNISQPSFTLLQFSYTVLIPAANTISDIRACDDPKRMEKDT